MPELRRDPITGRWVLFSPERSRRPADFLWEERTPPSTICSFCPGHEAETPPEIWADRDPGTRRDGPGWRVRVVPNKFPALRVEETLERSDDGPYERMNGTGAHEVFIEGNTHAVSVTALPHEVFRATLFAYRERLRDLKRDRRLAHCLIFKNAGLRAGASIAHCHSQLIATPVVPAAVTEELDGARRYFERRGVCAWCDILRYERAARARIVVDAGEFVAIAPYASRFPFETWVLPADHGSHFEELADGAVDGLSETILTALGRIERVLGTPPVNVVLKTAPFAEPPLASFHWHFEILPRMTMVGGFEWGSGFHINPVTPEEAARLIATGTRVSF